MPRRFTSCLIDLPGTDTMVRVIGSEIEDHQQLEYFGMPCTLSQSWLEIEEVEDSETGKVIEIDAQQETYLIDNLCIEDYE